MIVKGAIRDFFRNHFQRRDRVRVELPRDFVESKLGDEEGLWLTREFSEEEIRRAVWDCRGLKSPGPDGFSMEFFKGSWEVIKDDLCRVLAEFHSNGKLTRSCNASYIVLIPKKEGAVELNQFRPVSLIGGLYKILAKLLALRMKEVMGPLVGEAQTAFLKDRNILDGVVILNEVVEDAKRRKEERLVLKVDFAKAYDSVEWDYLFDMLRLMNFPLKWVGWIRECVSTASANVLVNGSLTGEFKMERGIRQGDPLSHFLFLVAAEGLNLLTKRAVARGLLKACKMGRERVEVSHIQYADDTLFMVEGNKENVEALRWLLMNFELVSGLSVNFDKSVAFGVNIERDRLENMVEGWGCRVEKLPIPYLGLKIGGRLGGSRVGGRWWKR